MRMVVVNNNNKIKYVLRTSITIDDWNLDLCLDDVCDIHSKWRDRFNKRYRNYKSINIKINHIRGLGNGKCGRLF